MTALTDQIRTDNLTTWLEIEALKLGSDNQRERWAAHLLPDDEIAQLARAELYKGFERCERWHTSEVRPAMRNKLTGRHTPQCPGVPLEFEIADVAELAADEWDTLKKLHDLVVAVNMHPWMFRQKAEAQIASFTHWVTCKNCQAEVCRSGAKVSIPWAGRILVREFKL